MTSACLRSYFSVLPLCRAISVFKDSRPGDHNNLDSTIRVNSRQKPSIEIQFSASRNVQKDYMETVDSIQPCEMSSILSLA